MKKHKVLIFGGVGMLGHKLVQTLSDEFEVFSTVRSSFSEIEHFNIFSSDSTIPYVDITNRDQIIKVLDHVQPEIVINAIGVIKQRPSADDVEQVLSINSIFPQRLATLASTYNFRLITVSTDCVFSGQKGSYSETDTPDATDLYGQSKRWGEVYQQNNCLTIRTSIIGRELKNGHSLIEWFLSNRGKAVKGFANAIYSGFPTIVFADIIKDIILRQPDLSGIFHVSSEPINKYELLCLIREAYEIDIQIERDENFQIDRSLNSDLFRRKVNFMPPTWPEMVKKMANDPTQYDKWHDPKF